ncbi:zinc finger BED domain-containing protein 3-like [Hydra vulgaris]|uniref:zinc finger BED domain-containing protein 3-like n=1 Tax=Hydra vulgaris TaxID=6087 RepID=UPI0032EA5F32
MSIVNGSKAWQYFCKEKSGESAICKKCNVKIMCKGFSTSGLLRHLKNTHKDLDLNMKRLLEDTGSENKIVQKKITLFVKQQTIEEIVSKLATVDGFSINAITKSEFIRKSLSEKGMLYIEDASLSSSNNEIVEVSRDNESMVSDPSIPQPVAPYLLGKSILTLEQKLDATICNVKQVEKAALENISNLKNLTKEIKLFEATGKRSESLERIYSTLMTIKPTSIESERAFSAAGLFMGKIRSRLSDKSIDCLCFLKQYFILNSNID